MSTRTRAAAWMAAVGLLGASPVLAQERTDREIVDLIVRDGPQARAIRAEIEVVRREQQARLPYPNPAVIYSREGAGFTEFFQVEQQLPPFGLRAALARAGVEATAAAEAARDARLWSLRADAATAVARLIGEQDRLAAAESSVRAVERLVDVLRTREREGEGSRFDRLRAEQELRDARAAVTAAAIAVADARAALAGLLPRDVTLGAVTRTAAGDAPRPNVDALIARSRETRAELRALDREARRAEVEADAARRARLPAPAVLAGLKRAGDGGERARGGVIGISLSLPLFDSGSREAARWNAERVRLEAERAALEERIRAEIVRAAAALALRHAAVSQDTDAADELMQIAETAYREGEVGILELLDAVRTSTRARLRSIDMRLETRLAQIALERAVGEVLWP